MHTEVSKTLDIVIYPDLAERGGFAPAFQSELNRLGSSLKIADDLSLPILWPSIAHGDRSCQVLLAAHERSFSVSCWHGGIAYGTGWTSDLHAVARLFRVYLEKRVPLKELEWTFPWFAATEEARLRESSPRAYVESRWKTYECRDAASLLDSRLHQLICESGKRPELRQLLPFTSLGYFCFSRTTGYPFASKECPYAYALGDNTYRVVAPSPNDPTADEASRIAGEGDAFKAATLLVNALPTNCGPAVDGTADTFTG
jgi:hypothetical protein